MDVETGISDNSVTNPVRVSVATLVFCLASGAAAQDDSGQPDFELPGGELGNTVADGGFEHGDVDFSGNPAGSMFSWWPEDLVLAPIPGYSPQLGWTLAHGGAYFLSEQVEDGPPPSALGAFVFGAENGSFAAGLAGKFHRRDDRFRLRAGAGFMDIRYQYYGSSFITNEPGLAVDVLQRRPVYFGSACVRPWRRLYIGVGYAAGSTPRSSISASTATCPSVSGMPSRSAVTSARRAVMHRFSS
jgi:hypothetical protein